MTIWALDDLRWHWGDAYEITDMPGWRARRRDGKGDWITAPDAGTLADRISQDYTQEPVSRNHG